MSNLPKTLPAFFWQFLKKQWKLFAFIQFFCFGWSFDHTLWPYAFKLVIDAITEMTDRTNMWSILTPLLFAWGALWIFVEVSFRMAGILMARAIPKFEADIRMAMFNYVQHHSYRYFSENLAGSMANKISDLPRSASNVVQMVMYLFLPVALAIVIMTGFFLWMMPMFAVIITGWVFLHLAVCFGSAKRCSYYSDIHAEMQSTLAGKIVDSFTNHVSLRLFSRHAQEYNYLMDYQKQEQKTYYESLWFIEKIKIVLGILSFVFLGLVNTWYMLYAWQQGYITTGEVVFIFTISWNIGMMVWISGMELPKLFKEIGICQQALSVVRDTHEVKDVPNAKPLVVRDGRVSFKDVSFYYNPSMRIFDGKNVEIAPGEKVGLVGFSGSGKSTFVNLILRNFDLEKGTISIDGQDISSVTQDSLRQQIAMIPQDPSLFHRTLMENIRYGRLEASEEEVLHASTQAHCHEFIMKMPQGYDTIVGERGAKLSGGQRQRIAIARAILKNAPILILDEATSALDSVTERYIHEALEKLMQNRTTIVIAHRLSTLAGMDRILVFSEGKIIEQGTHEELIKKNGHYANMWRMQAGGFLPEDQND